jgi:hypothetical protein
VFACETFPLCVRGTTKLAIINKLLLNGVVRSFRVAVEPRTEMSWSLSLGMPRSTRTHRGDSTITDAGRVTALATRSCEERPKRTSCQCDWDDRCVQPPMSTVVALTAPAGASYGRASLVRTMPPGSVSTTDRTGRTPSRPACRHRQVLVEVARREGERLIDMRRPYPRAPSDGGAQLRTPS